jgi:CDP-6-deoxy-D-xylo-4-hexulose-3-dehydrase
LNVLNDAEIEYRIITGGNFLRHDVIKYFNYQVTKSSNADLVHDNGFFVGNNPVDIRDKIDYLYKTLRNI